MEIAQLSPAARHRSYPPKKKKEEEAVHEIGQIWSGIMRPFDKSGRELSKTPISENVPF